MLLEVQCEVSSVCDDLGYHVICWCWSTVFSEVHSQRSHLPGHFRARMLPSADKLYGDDDFIFKQDLAPAHTAKGTKSWFNDHGVTVLDWPANSPDLNPIEYERGPRLKDDLNPIEYLWERSQTQQCRWAEGCYQSNLGFITLEQCHRLIASMPRRSNSCKRRPNQVLSAYKLHTFFQKPDISVSISFLYWSYVIF